MHISSYRDIVEKASSNPKTAVAAIAAAADLKVIKAALMARSDRIADPVFIGARERINEILRSLDKRPSDFSVVEPPAGLDEAQTAVCLIRDGTADFLMKGMIETSAFLRPVVKKRKRPENRGAHVTCRLQRAARLS